MTAEREDRLGRLCEELEQALAAGESLDLPRIAKRFDVAEADVDRAIAALQVMQGALAEDQLTSAADLKPPELPDDYELLGELGRGGMGIVYRAHQKSLDRDLAVKVLRPGDLMFGEAVQRFEREAKSLARLRHRHIVSVHEVGNVDGFVYFTMDLIDGRTLAERLREAPMTTAQTVRLLLQVTSAIAYAHGKSVMHRDLKPANILIDQDEDAFVVDFGLARDLGAAGGATLTGQMLGTPAYMSPEQALGDSDRIGETSDVYALGAVLYECLTGRAPFAGLPLAQLMHAVIEHEPDAIRRHNPRVPLDLQIICEKAMQKNPVERYATVQALAEDLERFSIGQAILARPRTFWSHSARFVRRNRRAIMGAGVPALLLLACAWWFVMPAVMRGRTGALAERLYASGSSQGAVAAYRDAYADMEPGAMPWAVRVRYLQALIDEACRLYVNGSGPDASSADTLVDEAKRVRGDVSGHSYYDEIEDASEDLFDAWRFELYRLEPLVGRTHLSHNLDLEMYLERVESRDQEVAREADLVCVLWSVKLQLHDAGLSKRQREAVLTLLPVAARLPSQFKDRLNWIARGCWLAAPLNYIDLPFLQGLIDIVSDRSVPDEQRKDAACLFHKCGYMPFLTKALVVESPRGTRHEFSIEDADLAWLLQAWNELRDVDRLDQYRRRVDAVVDRFAAIEYAQDGSNSRAGRDLTIWIKDHTACAARGREAIVTWWQENRGADPRALLLRGLKGNATLADLTIDDLIERLRVYYEAPHAHHLLALRVDEHVPVPFLGEWNRSQVVVKWQRALNRLAVKLRTLRVATFAMIDGAVVPRLVGSHQQALGDNDVIEWAYPVQGEMPFVDASVAWRHWRNENRGPQLVKGKAVLSWQNSEPRLNVSSFLHGVMSADVQQSVSYGGDADINDGHVGFLGGAGLRGRGGYASYEYFTVATMRPVTQDDRVWTIEDWMAAFAETLDFIGSGQNNPAVNHAKHVAFATFFSMSHKLERLKQFDATLAQRSTSDYLLFIRKASRLLAGDEDAIDYDTSSSWYGHSSEFLDVGFWARLAAVTPSKKLRDHAFEQLQKFELDAGLLRTFASNEELAPHLPEWLATQAATAPTRLAGWFMACWRQLLALFAHVAGIVLGICLMRRGIGWRRRISIYLLVPAGLLLPFWSVGFAGQEWNPQWLGHAVHVLGVWAFCWRATRGIAWQVVALFWTGTTVAYVTGNLDQPFIVWSVAVFAVLTMSSHKNMVLVPPTSRSHEHAADRAATTS